MMPKQHVPARAPAPPSLRFVEGKERKENAKILEIAAFRNLSKCVLPNQ